MANQITAKITGIYAILSNIDGRFYIGRSKDIISRWRKHFYELEKQIHGNIYLQNFYDKYGKNIFTFVIVEECPKEDLARLEKQYIENWRATKEGFNLTDGGEGGMPPKPVSFRNIKTGEIHTEPSINIFAEKYNLCLSSLRKLKCKKSWFHKDSCHPDRHPDDKPKKIYKLISPAGELVEFNSMANFSREHNFSENNVSLLLSGKQQSAFGWTREDSRYRGEALAGTFEFFNPQGEKVIIKNLSKFTRDNNLPKGGMINVVLGRSKSCAGWSQEIKYCKKYDNRPLGRLPKEITIFNSELNKIIKCDSVRDFCKEYHLETVTSQIYKILKGKLKRYGEWSLPPESFETLNG